MPPVNNSPGLEQAVERLLYKSFPPPPKETSWLRYQNAIRVEEDHGTVGGVVLPEKPLLNKPRKPVWDSTAARPPAASGAGTILPPADDYRMSGQSDAARGSSTFYQRRAEPIFYAFLEGFALRLAYPIPCPELVDVNGFPVKNANRLDRGEGFRCWVIGNALYPVYRADWRIRYLVTGGAFAGDLEVPPNPSLA